MKKNLAYARNLIIAALMVLTFSDCGKSPTQPDTTPTPIVIYPASSVFKVGAQQTFVASGGDGKNYSWSFPNGGATKGNCSDICVITAGSQVGVYPVVVSSGGLTAQAQLNIVAESGVSLNTMNPVSGTRMKFGQTVTLNIQYVSPVQGTIRLEFLTQDGSVARTSSSSGAVPLGTNSVIATGTVVDAIMNGVLQPTPFTTKFIRVKLLKLPDLTTLVEMVVPAEFIWE